MAFRNNVRATYLLGSFLFLRCRLLDGCGLLCLRDGCFLVELVACPNLNEVTGLNTLLDGLHKCRLVDTNFVLSCEMLGDGLHGRTGAVVERLDALRYHNGIGRLGDCRDGGLLCGHGVGAVASFSACAGAEAAARAGRGVREDERRREVRGGVGFARVMRHTGSV